MTITKITFDEAAASFDRNAIQSVIEVAEKERQELVRKFPMDAWPSMPLTRYALGLGNNEESFCWWMEWGTANVGSMRGGSAGKHIIYRQRNGDWWFDRNIYKDEQGAWQAVRAGFVKAFELGASGEWDAIDEVDAISSGPTLRTKTLHCYFPDQLLPISSIQHIVHYQHCLGDHEASANGYHVIRQNRQLLAMLRKRPALAGWSTQELTRFLYQWANPRDQRRIVKIAPGANANLWDECFPGGYISVGWGEVGDLRDFASKDDFMTKFGETYFETYNGHRSTISKKAKEVWTLRDLEPGDFVVANQGIDRIVAVGTVVEPGYEYKPERAEHRHLLHVKWDTSYEKDIPPQRAWAFVTVATVPQDLAATILSKGSGPIGPVPVDALYRELADALERKGQAILYGPPGTGKTFTARRFSVWWLMEQMGGAPPALLADAAAFTQAEQKLSSAQVMRRVWWVVANPNEWSWDSLFKERKVEYRHGRLQRNYPLVRRGDLVVGYQSTPDKRLVALARVSREMFTNSAGDPAIELEPVAKIENGLTYNELQADPILSGSEPIQFRNQGTLFALTENEFDHLGALLTERDPELKKHLESGDVVGPLTRLTFHPSYSYEDFIEGYRPTDSKNGTLTLKLEDGVFKRVCRAAQANPKKPYLVLIDEINRANVAKVLGETITLLEMDKRGLIISLPQSKEAFMIPPNVFVLGTMNTADRSIKLLDTALRRRFAFLELMPDSSLLTGTKIGQLALSDFLEMLNARIAAKEGREKQIGHSFLMEGGVAVSEPEEFSRRFRQEILPLLQEYCYDDYRVLAEYIGSELVDQEGQVLNEDRMNDPDLLLAALEKEFASETKQ